MVVPVFPENDTIGGGKGDGVSSVKSEDGSFRSKSVERGNS